MPDRNDKLKGPIPGAPADSLMGLGGQDGFVGQCERELCLSMPPPPPPKPEPESEPKQSVTRSYPPIPIPSLPEMPLRARMLRPWMGVAASAVLIAIVSLASGDDDEAGAPANAASMAATQSDTESEEADTPTTLSFGSELSKVATAALAAGKAEAARRAAEEAEGSKDGASEVDASADDNEDEDEDEDEDEATRRVASGSSSKVSKKKTEATGAFSRDAARSAIFSAASRASGCRTKNGPKGRGRATVTIGPNGGVTSVSVSPPFAGTKSGHCVASMFRSVRIAPFAGGAVTLGKSFTVR